MYPVLPLLIWKKLKKMPFPIPPMEVQEEIVRILDRIRGIYSGAASGAARAQRTI